MKLECRSFGFTKEDSEVLEFTVSNDKGSSVSILNFGAAVRKLLIPDREGKPRNIVLGYDDISAYETNAPYLGVTVGRYAGRIAGARFTIDGVTYGLEKNNGGNCLHGGFKGLSRVAWDISSVTVGKNEAGIRMTYLSRDGEDRFPGNVMFAAEYILDNNNELTVIYSATTDMATPVNMTNHSYFNLNGDLAMDAGNHMLTMSADTYIVSDESTLGVGESGVEGTPFDFRNGRRISDGFDSTHPQLKLFNGYDHVFRLSAPGTGGYQVKLSSDVTGISMKMNTTNEAIVFYTSNFMDDSLELSDGQRSKYHLGVCLETQYFPNDMNVDFIETRSIIEPGTAYCHKTTYTFTAS